MDFEFFMKEAIKMAEKAYEIDEVPIGCVIVYDNKVIASGYNKRNLEKNVLCHAEIIAINEACKVIQDWRLEECTLFVSVEPCPMCAGAILQSRIKTVVFGCENPKAGCCGSILNIVEESRFNHQVEVVKNILQEECSELMKSFFKNRRSKKPSIY